tara:strand:- start:917 stop:1618 length:702 start_codon:yes stop_codon:yes gene_type:complete
MSKEENLGPSWWYDESITAEPEQKCSPQQFRLYNDNGFCHTFTGFAEPFIDHNWYKYKFPKRVFLLGGGPSLEILYQYIMRDDKKPDYSPRDWGKWAEMRGDITHVIHPFVSPSYSIRLNPNFRERLEEYVVGEKIIVGRPRGNSMAEFLQIFEEHGGEEVFLFGFDSNGSGYWNKRKSNVNRGSNTHSSDWLFFNLKVLPVLSLKIHHIGETMLDVNKIMSIEDLLENYIRG